ncbi:HCL670Wp [Eremothecium sinecaudum]|uniref:HCL670Wp n=1 Tax=Eremothecium sinecaudum TaxID=45286 RepID=A0A109UXR2_9SACH|nr:HCL670Wp [Eremothecium sinecaudum]AMD19481.1 HCL670Wp [Eremothecium sinecaudum]
MQEELTKGSFEGSAEGNIGRSKGQPLHRHKRSFAISGDFEFLKSYEEKKDLGDNARRTNFSPRPLSYGGYTSEKILDNRRLNSRYFEKEDRKFGSGYLNVPDATIDLDEALRTTSPMTMARRSPTMNVVDPVIFHRRNVVRSVSIEEETRVQRRPSDMEKLRKPWPIRDLDGRRRTSPLLHMQTGINTNTQVEGDLQVGDRPSPSNR